MNREYQVELEDLTGVWRDHALTFEAEGDEEALEIAREYMAGDAWKGRCPFVIRSIRLVAPNEET